MYPSSMRSCAVGRLTELARLLEAGHPVPLDAAWYDEILACLPPASRMPRVAKRALRTIARAFERERDMSMVDRLLECRFDIDLEDDWQGTQSGAIGMLWDLLDALPDGDVEGSRMIWEVTYDEWRNDYAEFDAARRRVAIGSGKVAHLDKLARAVRHEVGHVVHARNRDLVDEWLQCRFGWLSIRVDDVGVDAWVGLLGGWGGLTDDERRDVRSLLASLIGPGERFSPPSRHDQLPEKHAWYRKGFAAREVAEAVDADWHVHYQDWYQLGSRRFCQNDYYRTLMAVDDATFATIARMPSPYAAMSPGEFFAELYAYYHDPDGDARQRLPADVVAWLEENLGPA
jgi:hypothetical protein